MIIVVMVIIKEKLARSSSIGRMSAVDSKYTLDVGDGIKIEEEIGLDFDLAKIDSELKEMIIKKVPKGSILQVVDNRKTTNSSQLIFKVCHLPAISHSYRFSNIVALKEGDLGSIKTGELEKKNLKNLLTHSQLSVQCPQNKID